MNSPHAAYDPGQFLRVEQLRPADIILSRSPEKFSDLVAAGTFGEYSHAAIVIQRSLIFESTDDGVGPRALLIDKMEDHSDGIRYLASVAPSAAMIVLRHEGASRVEKDDDALSRRLLYITQPHVGDEYPSWEVLADATRFLGWVPWQKRWILRTYQQGEGREPPSLPGLFCSALVAKVYADLGLELFDRKTEVHQVSPNLLRKSPHLQPVEDAFAFPDTAAPDLEGFRRKWNGVSETMPRAAVIPFSRSLKQMAKTLRQFQEVLQLQLKRNEEILQRLRSNQPPQ